MTQIKVHMKVYLLIVMTVRVQTDLFEGYEDFTKQIKSNRDHKLPGH